MGFLSDVFGSETETESKVKPYDKQQLKDMLARLETMGGTPMEMYPDQMYADMTPEQQQALDMRRQFAGGMGQMVDPAMEAWQSSLNAPDVANNPYVQGMINQQATTLNRNLGEMMPGIDASMLGVNERLGGSGQGVAQGIAARGTQEALANAMAQTQMGAYGQGLGQQRYAMGAAPGMAQFGMMPADIMMGVGDVERTEGQRGLTEDISRFNFAQQEPWQRLQNQAAIFNPLSLPYASTKSKTESTPSAFSSTLNALTGGFSGAMGVQDMMGGGGGGGGGMGGGLMSNFTGGGGMGGGGFGMGGGGTYGSALAGSSGGPSSFMSGLLPMFSMSDRRLKTDINRIGQTPAGQPVYSYTIFGRAEIGVMSDESPAEAVHRHPSGYDMVDYARIK